MGHRRLMAGDLAAGAYNCVVECARIGEGDHVFIVNERGAVDQAVTEAIGAVARELGAEVVSIWGDPIPKDRADDIPATVLGAYRDGDIVISHYPSLNREALHPHFPGEKRPRIPNRARTEDLLATGWARFPYRLQLAIAGTLDDLMAPGKPWHITSANGTDVRGEFGANDSTVAQAYFVDQDDGGRARRNFPGGVHSPKLSVGTEGVVVADYIDNVADGARATPLRIELKDNRCVAMDGGDAEGAMRAQLAETDGYLDSWHAGVNPKTVVPYGRAGNPKQWFSYAHCSPMIVHFHQGRSHAPVNVACFGHTITIDGRTIYQDGRLAILDDARVLEAIAAVGAAPSLLDNDPIPLW